MNEFKPLTVQAFGERALLVEFEAVTSKALLKKIIACSQNLEEKFGHRMIVHNTYTSLLLNFQDTISPDFSTLKKEVGQIIEQTKTPHKIKVKQHEVPVCYATEFGWDLQFLADEKQLDPDEIIELHQKPNYTVFFTGFLPGFPYLGGLDERLHSPRKEEPRQKIEKGAVGIAGSQTGIYPQESPGGWQIIGKSPIDFFKAEKKPPVFFNPGDHLTFKAITKSDFITIKKEVESGTYTLKSHDYEF